MKKANIIALLAALLTAGSAAFTADADSNSATNTTAANVPSSTVLADTNMVAEPIPTNGIVLNFHSVPLGTVLNYLSAKAGLVIVSDANLQGTVTVVARNPITTNEVVDLLNNQLSKNDLTAVLEGRTLNIMSSERAKSLSSTPVKQDIGGPAQIPIDDEIVTEILPVQTLSPEQLVKDLESLIPKDATVSANEAGSAIIMTAPQRDIHRISEIISDLDSSSVSDVEVFILKYADAKSVASELKEVFESADSDVARANTRNNFASRMRGGGGFAGMFGGGGGGGNESNSNDKNGKNAQTHAIFSSDDQMNAVIASAPPGYMPYITNVIDELDQPSQDITEIKVFKLKHADPVEI
ncbi:MAG TPA: secretin N-terminal domain-containing protein, partial [Verrucomicrobiae bacterium]